MSTEAREDVFLRRMNDLNTRYLQIVHKLLGFDLKIAVYEAWSMVQDRCPLGEVVDTTDESYRMFARLGREVGHLEHQKELAAKAQLTLSKWSQYLDAQGKSKDYITTRADLNTQWQYKYQALIQKLAYFNESLAAMEDVGFNLVHGRCRNFFRLELENSKQTDRLVKSLKKIAQDTQESTNEYVSKNIAKDVYSKATRFRSIKHNYRNAQGVATYVKSVKVALGLSRRKNWNVSATELVQVVSGLIVFIESNMT